MATSISTLNSTCPFPRMVPIRGHHPHPPHPTTRPAATSPLRNQETLSWLRSEETMHELVSGDSRPPRTITITVFQPTISYGLAPSLRSTPLGTHAPHLSSQSITAIYQFVHQHGSFLRHQAVQVHHPMLYPRKISHLPRSLVFTPDGATLVLLNRTKIKEEQDNLLGKGTYKKVTLAVDMYNPGKVYASAGSRLPLTAIPYSQYAAIPGTIQCFHSFDYIGSKPNPDGLKSGKSRLILEFCNYGTLCTAIRDRKLSPQQKQSIFREALLHIKTLHDHEFVHRDLKPANILLHKDRSGNITPKFGDIDSYTSLSNKEELLINRTTIFYISPEYASTLLETDWLLEFADYKKLDVWCFGVCMYELFFEAELPWHDTKYTDLTKKISQLTERWFLEPSPGTFEHLIWEALDPNPGTRIDSHTMYMKAMEIAN